MNFSIPVAVALIDHHDSFTYNIVSWLRDAGLSVQVFTYDLLDLIEQVKGFDAILYSPGPGHPAEYLATHQLINHYRGLLPQIGICLGMQMMLLLSGNKIERTGPIHGKVALIRHTKKGFFWQLSTPTAVARYHSLGCTDSLGFERTAEVNGVTMGIQNDQQKMIGVQFHPESFLTHHAHTMAKNLKRWIEEMNRPPHE